MAFIIRELIQGAERQFPGTVGPAGVNRAVAALLRQGNGIPFRLTNDDSTLRADGLLISDGTTAHPVREALEEYGADVGATRVLMARGDGVWVDIQV